jgi:membrane fusion protein (multidrug efflux system)
VSEENDQANEAVSRPAPRGGMRRIVGLSVLAVALVVVAIWGFGRWRHARTHVSTDNAQVDAHIVPVLAKVGGYVREVRIQDNQRVEGGDLVVVIDDTDLRLRLESAEADLAMARAAVGENGVPGKVEAEVSAARAHRQALEARLASARAEQERAARDLERIEELAAKQITSSQQLDAARAAATTARAATEQIEQEISAARASETSAGAAVRQADAQLQRATVAVASARSDLEESRVSAPITGTVSQTQVEIGQLVQPGQPLAAVVPDSPTWITANLKETELDEVHDGQDVSIEVDAYPGCEAHGRVESLSPATGARFALIPPDNATGNFTKVVQRVPVRIGLVEGCGAQRPLRPGMSVVVHIDVG